MAKIPVYNKQGEKIEEMEISDILFSQKRNDALLHQVYMILSGNERRTIAHTKDRSERAGTGKKPWKQKGTGRARAGAVRSPLWKKGGVTFGPNKEQNFTRSINVKMRNKATLIVLSQKLESDTLVVFDSFEFENKKTSEFEKMLTAKNIQGSILAGFSASEQENRRLCRNIENISEKLAVDISAKSLMDSKYLIVSKEAFQLLEKRLIS